MSKEEFESAVNYVKDGVLNKDVEDQLGILT